MALRTLFCGTPKFAVPALKALVDHDHFEVVGVISQPDRRAGRGKKWQASAVKQWALTAELPVWTPAKARDGDFVESIRQQNFDLAVVVAYGQILSQEFLDLFPRGCFNLHGSLLPRWRGAAPIQRSLMAGDPHGGVCLQKMVFALDAGDVIGQREMPFPSDLGAAELYSVLSAKGCDILTGELLEFLRGERPAVPQDEALVTIAQKITKAEAGVDWGRSAAEIHNQVRGLNMGPYAFARFRDKTLKIHQTQLDPSPPGAERASLPPGTLLDIEKESLLVQTGTSPLRILVVQPESKAKMPAGDFARGFQVKKGECFDRTPSPQ